MATSRQICKQAEEDLEAICGMDGTGGENRPQEEAVIIGNSKIKSIQQNSTANKVLELTPGNVAALRGLFPAGAVQHNR